MFDLGKLGAMLRHGTDTATKDELARLLQTSPEALDAFEDAYRRSALPDEFDSDNFFDMSSRQASAMARQADGFPDYDGERLSALIGDIVAELVAETDVMSVTDGKVASEDMPRLPDGHEMLGNADLTDIPLELRPQLTGELMKVDIDRMSYEMVLTHYMRSQDGRLPTKARRASYHMFRQGMDILDLDPVLYGMLGRNPNSMSHWLPPVASATSKHGFFRIPRTRIAKVPMPILQLSRIDYDTLTPSTLKAVDDWAFEVFDLDVSKTYFVKTGTYSSKFDFRNAKVTGEREVRELGEYLLFIQHQATMMAGPLTQPSIYGVSTTNEWVVREFIEDVEGNPTIYKGLPLHTEYRVFVDCDTDEVLGIAPYWEPETMKRRFSQMDDADSPHQRHDYVIYRMHEDTLMGRYEDNKDAVLSHIREILPDIELSGQWSIDIMQNGDDFWLIDMATADTSALKECVPDGLLRKTEEDWLPRLQSDGQDGQGRLEEAKNV